MARYLIPSDTFLKAIKPGDPRKRISDGDAAKLLRKSPGTLGNWRTYQTGPRYSNIGRTIYYTLPDLAAFILGHE